MKTARPVVHCCIALGLTSWLVGSQALAASGAAAVRTSIEPLEISFAMRIWTERELGERETGQSPAEGLALLRRLMVLLTSGRPAGIQGILGPTPTAAEAFANRRADCLGFALLLVALARDRGVEAGFVLSGQILPTDRGGTLQVRRGHVAATYSGRVFDLGGERAFDPRQDAFSTDRETLALFFSNRGAQSLLAGHAAEAVELLYQSVRFDPSIPCVWSNLGVALRRSGDLVGALLAHQMARRLEPALDKPTDRAIFGQ